MASVAKNDDMKFFIILQLFAAFLGHGPLTAQKSNYTHGLKLFNKLAKNYPHHFTLKDTDGSAVEIEAETVLGGYLLEKLSNKTEAGWIFWRDTAPVGAPPGTLSQCGLYNKHDWVELRFSNTFKEVSSSTESFWIAMIFELNNATLGNQFKILHKSLKEKKLSASEYKQAMVKLEYQSALKTKSFVKLIWGKYCKTNNIPVTQREWFFKEGTTLDGWLKMLHKTQRGRRYLDFYEKEARTLH